MFSREPVVHCLAFKYPWLQLPRILRLCLLLLPVTGLLPSHLLLKQGFTPVGAQSAGSHGGECFQGCFEGLAVARAGLRVGSNLAWFHCQSVLQEAAVPK